MRFIKKFNENEKSVEDWCIELELESENYSIRDNGIVDTTEYTRIDCESIEKIPIQFGISDGDFSCEMNNLISLNGSPNKVIGEFNCSWNKLSTLEGGPTIVDGEYDCRYNDLISLEGGPKKLDGFFYCDNNPIYRIYELFGSYEKYKASLDFNYLRPDNKIFKRRLEKALKEIGQPLPKKPIIGYEYID
jgi:hypothetical protein